MKHYSELEVVCLVGSTKFIDVFRSEEKRLTMEGKVVLSVATTKEEFGIIDDSPEKEMLTEIHRRKISMSDRIHVINPNGYCGLHTEEEINFATIVLEKAVTYYDSSREVNWFPDNYKYEKEKEQ